MRSKRYWHLSCLYFALWCLCILSLVQEDLMCSIGENARKNAILVAMLWKTMEKNDEAWRRTRMCQHFIVKRCYGFSLVVLIGRHGDVGQKKARDRSQNPNFSWSHWTCIFRLSKVFFFRERRLTRYFIPSTQPWMYVNKCIDDSIFVFQQHIKNKVLMQSNILCLSYSIAHVLTPWKQGCRQEMIFFVVFSWSAV